MPYCERNCIHSSVKDNCVNLLNKQGQILSKHKNTFGTVWKEENVFYLYYADFQNMYRAKSKDGMNWQADKVPLLQGELYNWDEGIDCTTVFKDNGIWHCFYRGHNWRRLPSHCIGLAHSNDGVNWEKNQANPIIIPDISNWDGKYLAKNKPVLLDPWGIIKISNKYYLWFNSDTPDMCRCTGLATSTDLVNWKKDKNNPIFINGRFCVSPFKYKDFYYLIVTSGGFQRKYNYFELYKDKSPTFYDFEREYIGRILECGEEGDFDEGYIDAPNILTDNIYRNSFPTNPIGFIYYTGETSIIGQWSHGFATLDFNKL